MASVFKSGAAVRFGFCGPSVPDRLEQTTVAEPVDPLKGCVFDGLEAAPWAATPDDFRL
jgi:hypothetical protein